MILNRITPLDELRRDNARVMHALVVAMKAAQNWYDTLAVADLIIDVQVCRFGPMLREAEHEASDRPMTAGQAATLAGEQSEPGQPTPAEDDAKDSRAVTP